jgi:hypothetical protein
MRSVLVDCPRNVDVGMEAYRDLRPPSESMEAWRERQCISCRAPLPRRASICPACGAINTRGMGATGGRWGAGRALKRFRLLWWTWTLRDSESDYVEIASDFGVRMVVSRGRWIVSWVVIIAAFTGLTLSGVALWAASRDLVAAAVTVTLGSLVAIAIWTLIWSMTGLHKRT